MKKKIILLVTGASFNNVDLIKQEMAKLGDQCEFHRLGIKYNEHLFKGLNVKVDNWPSLLQVDTRYYDKVLVFRDFGFEDVNAGADTIIKRTDKKRLKVIDAWDKTNSRLFQNKCTKTNMTTLEMLNYWSDVLPMDGTYLERSLSSTTSAWRYMEGILGIRDIDLKGEFPSMRIELAKNSIKLFYVFRYIFPNVFSRLVWYGFMCHNGLVYCLFSTIGKNNAMEVTRVAFHPGTHPTTSDMFAATLRTMNPGRPNLPERKRSYIIQKYSSFEEYLKEPDNAYLLSQDKFVGLNIQSGNMFLVSLDQDGKIKMEGIQ